MKRGSGDDSDYRPKAKRRPKASEACLACRKAKTRCEPAAEPSRDGCHRCTVLFLQCSFLESPSSSATTPAGSSSASSPAYSHGPIIKIGNYVSFTEPIAITTFDATGFTLGEILTLGSPHNEKGHWVTAPMLAVQELLLGVSVRNSREGFAVPAHDVLDAGQIRFLQDIFETIYTPWLNLPYTLPSRTSPPTLTDFLTLVRCAVAARHLPPDLFAVALPHLQKLVEHALLVHVFNASRSASPEAVQALLILSQWSPAIGPLASDVQDASVIAKAAVKMGVALGLDSSMDKLIEFRRRVRRTTSMSLDDDQEHKRLIYNIQLWATVCNAEWGLCLGTNQVSSSKPLEGLYDILNPRVFSESASMEDIQGFRLYLVARLIAVTSQGLSTALTDSKTFASDLEGLVAVYSATKNCLLPLLATFPHARVHLDVVLMMNYWNALLVFLHGLTQVRIGFEAAEPGTPWLEAIEDGKARIANRWGIMLENAASSVILTFLDVVERYQASMASNIPTALHGYSSAQNYHPLATAPDSIFSVVLCAAFALTHVQAVMMLWRRKRTITRFTTEALLRRLADTLDSIAISEEHAPRRVAAVVRQLRQAWHEIITVQIPVEHNWPRSPGEELVEMPQGSQDDLAMANMFGVRAGYAVTKHWLYEHGHPMAMGAGVPLAYGESSASSSSPSFELGAGAVGSSDATVGPAEDDFWASFLGTLGGPGGF